MTKEQLEEIRKRADAATPGPWGYSPMMMVYSNDGCMHVDCGINWDRSRKPDVNPCFIAHARQDIPALLDRIAKLEVVAEAARHLADMYDDGCQCGYYNEDATEETGMNICGACAVDTALKRLDESGE